MTPPSFNVQAAFAKTQTEALAELLDVQNQTIGFGASLKDQTTEALNARPSEKKWSCLECLEHLNRYAKHYLPKLEEASRRAPTRRKEQYKPGLLGKPFAIAMHPAKRSTTMSSPSNMNPFGSEINPSIIEDFISYQTRFQRVLNKLEGLSLRGSRIPISIVPFVRLHLGDMLHTLVWHHARHTLQAQEALSSYQAKK